MAFNCSSGTTQVNGNIDAVIAQNNLTLDVTTGNGTARTDTYVVPAGKKWILKNIYASRINAGNIQIEIDSDGTTGVVEVQFAATRATIQGVVWQLAAGDEVIVTFATGVSANIYSCIGYEEYDA